jgi:hypothetical protein
MSIPPELIQAVRESRIAVTREYEGLLSELDVPQRIRKSFKHHPIRWLGGAAVTGLLTTVLGAKSSVKSSGTVSPPKTSGNAVWKLGWGAVLLEVGKLLFPILRPVLLQFVGRAMQAGISKKIQPR